VIQPWSSLQMTSCISAPRNICNGRRNGSRPDFDPSNSPIPNRLEGAQSLLLNAKDDILDAREMTAALDTGTIDEVELL